MVGSVHGQMTQNHRKVDRPADHAGFAEPV
jgi:hypothetical protein